MIGESLWEKVIGKPDSGKLNVRFDEGELEIGLCHYASSLLYPHYVIMEPLRLSHYESGSEKLKVGKD